MKLRRLLIWSSVASIAAGLLCLVWFVVYQLDATLYEQRQTALIEEAAKDESPVPDHGSLPRRHCARTRRCLAASKFRGWAYPA